MSALGNTMSPALQRLGQVSVRLSVELGRADMALKDVLALAEGSVVSLDKLTDELLDVTANGQVIAHGEVIAQDGKFALRIVSLAGGEDAARPVSRPVSRPVPSSVPSSVPKAHIPTPSDVAPAASQPPAEPGAASMQPKADAPADHEAADAEPDVDDLLDALDELTDVAPAADAGSDEPEQDDTI